MKHCIYTSLTAARLIIHLFFHDVQESLSLQKNSLISFTELAFSLPASRDLWKAPTVEKWRDIYLSKKPVVRDTPMPRVVDIMQHANILDEYREWVDVELCYSALLHGYWGQIAAYREAVKFYQDVGSMKKNSNHQLWLQSQHAELSRDLAEFSTLIYSSQRDAPVLAIIAELFMMILHVAPDDLQNFAGKNGADEARRTAASLDMGWVRTIEARSAVWHAGQVFYNAHRLPPTSLRGFNAIAVYLATLTLWAYGLLSCSQSHQGQREGDMSMGTDPVLVFVDGEENRDTRAFLQLDRGIPGLMGDPATGFESLSNPGMILSIARKVYRDNFPVTNEPLPPLVESLGNLLRDLGSGPAGRTSRAPSENPA
jgi:hypothetical protein